MGFVNGCVDYVSNIIQRKNVVSVNSSMRQFTSVFFPSRFFFGSKKSLMVNSEHVHVIYCSTSTCKRLGISKSLNIKIEVLQCSDVKDTFRCLPMLWCRALNEQRIKTSYRVYDGNIHNYKMFLVNGTYTR